jgi:hypothetical protein
MRRLLIGLSAIVLAGTLHLAAAAAVDPFDLARNHIQAHQNAEATRLIESGQFDVNLQTSEGFSLLHYAAGAGNLEMVRTLLQKGADPTLKADGGTTPYQMAIGTMVQAEIRKAMARWNGAATTPGTGPAVNVRGRATPGGSGMCAMVRAEQVNDGRSIAMRPFLKAKDAVWYNHPDELEGLLDDCVRVDEQDQFGWTLLHHAADRDRVELARLLLARGASRSIRNKDGQTAPQLATSPEMKALLGPAGPSPRPAAQVNGKGDDTACQQKYQADAALASDFAGKSAAIRRWQQCLKTGRYW